jgi:hypothetical protein
VRIIAGVHYCQHLWGPLRPGRPRGWRLLPSAGYFSSS